MLQGCEEEREHTLTIHFSKGRRNSDASNNSGNKDRDEDREDAPRDIADNAPGSENEELLQREEADDLRFFVDELWDDEVHLKKEKEHSLERDTARYRRTSFRRSIVLPSIFGCERSEEGN